jgi:hypothetical protein
MKKKYRRELPAKYDKYMKTVVNKIKERMNTPRWPVVVDGKPQVARLTSEMLAARMQQLGVGKRSISTIDRLLSGTTKDPWSSTLWSVLQAVDLIPEIKYIQRRMLIKMGEEQSKRIAG